MAAPDSARYDLLDQLADEFAARFRRGERPSLKEYLDKYPDLADDIRQLFPAMVEMEQIKEDPRAPAKGPATPLVQQLGDYRVLREIGRGGMGVVYEAEQVSLGRRVALKVLALHAAKDGGALQRFRREAKAAARLHHTNIVPVFEVGQDGDTCFYAMQFIPGQPLDQVVEELRRQRADSASPPAQAEGGRPGEAPLRQLAHSLLTGQFRPQDLAAGTPPSERPASPATSPDGTAGCAPAAGAVGASTARMDAPAVLPGQTDLSSAEANRPHYIRSVARLGQQVAQALAYAHERGIIHRDIKPSNLLLDGSGVVWVTDFGLAKTEEEGLTSTGDILGTFRYMSPERFEGYCDARADLYSLGLTLYELLTLRPAFAASDRVRLMEQVQHTEPVRPRALDRRIPRDLETIVLKAIDKEPGRRYPTADEMAHDLQRFLDDESIHARRASPVERLTRLTRRNPVVAGLGTLVALLVLLVAVSATASALRLSAALGESERQRHEADKNLWESYLSQAQANRKSHEPGQRFASLRAIQKALQLPLPEGRSRDELRTEAIAALLLPDLEVAKEWDGWPAGSRGFAIDDAFQRYARGDKEGNVSVRRIDNDEDLFSLDGGGSPLRNYAGLAFSPDGRFLHQLWFGPRGFHARLWRLDRPGPVAVLDDEHINCAFRPDSLQIAVGYPDGTIRLIATETGQEVRRLPSGLAQPDSQICWNPRLPQVLVRSSDVWRVIDLDTGKVVLEKRQPGGIDWMDWHPEGRLVAVSTNDQKIYLWDTVTDKPVLPPLEGHKNHGILVQFNRAGDRLVSNDWSGDLRLWDVRTGHQLLAQPAGGAWLQFSRDDGLLAADVTHAKVRLFRCRTGREFSTMIHEPATVAGSYHNAVMRPAGRLAACYATSGVALVDVTRLEEVALLPIPGNLPLRFEPGGDALLTYGSEGVLRWPVRLDPAARPTYRVGPPERLAATVALDWWGSSGDGKVIAIPNYSRGAFLWQRAAQRTIVLGPQQDVRSCAVSPDGRWVATGSHDLLEGVGAKVWDARNGQHVADLPVGGFCGVGFSPDSQWLLTTSGGVRIWQAGNWREGPALGGSTHNQGFAFTADGKLLALGDAPGVIRLLVPDSGREVARLTAPEPSRLIPCCFTADGTRLITLGNETHALHIFDLAAIREQLQGLSLDWDAPALPPAPIPAAAPLQVRIELGDLEDDLALGANPTAEHLRGLIAAISLSLSLQPLNYKGFRQRGRAFARLNLPQQAIDDYSTALLLMPSDHPARPEVLSRRAGNYLFLNDLARALADLDEADTIDPVLGTSLRHLQAAELAARASALERTKESRAAVLFLQQALTIAPDHAETCNHLAWLLLAGPRELRDPKQALTLARKAAELVPEQMLYQNTLGVALYRNDRFAEAVPILEKSLAASKGQSDAFDLFFLALCHHRLGNAGKSKEYHHRAVQWFQKDRGKLPALWVDELTQFQAEADEILAQPPG